MSSNSKFKWIRAKPVPASSGDIDFFSFNLKNMRQLASLAGTAIAGGGQTSVLSCYVPAGSWGRGKQVLMRGSIHLSGLNPPPPATYNVTEHIITSQTPTLALPTPPAFVPSALPYTTFRALGFIRIDPYIYVYDVNDCNQHGWMNQFDGVQHLIAMLPPIHPWDFTQQITLELQMKLPATCPAGVAQALNCEAFIEQGTNLGKLP